MSPQQWFWPRDDALYQQWWASQGLTMQAQADDIRDAIENHHSYPDMPGVPIAQVADPSIRVAGDASYWLGFKALTAVRPGALILFAIKGPQDREFWTYDGLEDLIHELGM